MTELQTSLSKCKIEGNILYLPPISDGALTNYSEVRMALLNAGAKYKRNTFVFPNAAQPYIDRLMGGDKENIKQEFQFFGTPNKLADKLVKMAEIESNHKILEPSAGQGAIIKAIQRVLPNHPVQWCELMDINQNVLFGLQNKQTFICPDFLEAPKSLNGFFDRIIANPPFNKNQDIDHIEKMYGCLKKGGRLVSIASKSWNIGSQKKQVAFREWLDKVGAMTEEIENGAFKESGTSVGGFIITIDK